MLKILIVYMMEKVRRPRCAVPAEIVYERRRRTKAPRRSWRRGVLTNHLIVYL